MRLGLPYLGKFASKLGLEVLPAVVASIAGAYAVSELHLARSAQQPVIRIEAPAPAPGLTGSEERALTRQMLRSRRETKETPAEVTPLWSPSPPERASYDSEHKAAAASQGELPTAALRRQPIQQQAAAAPAATEIAVSQPPGQVAPTNLSPIVVGASDPRRDAETASAPPPAEGLGAKLFSHFSTLVGTAANATGDTINFVIDLPGKAVAAGGKILQTETPPPSRRFIDARS